MKKNRFYSIVANSVCSIIETYSIKKLAEIGLYKCHGMKRILKKYDDIIDEYWGIDFYQNTYPHKKQKRQEKIQDYYHFRACRMMMFFKSFRILRMSSEQAAILFKERSEFPNWKPFDMVYIDAAHDYENVKNDIKCWKPLIKKGGIISGHDYMHPNLPDVKIAVDEYFGEVKTLPGYVWYIEI